MISCQEKCAVNHIFKQPSLSQFQWTMKALAWPRMRKICIKTLDYILETISSSSGRPKTFLIIAFCFFVLNTLGNIKSSLLLRKFAQVRFWVQVVFFAYADVSSPYPRFHSPLKQLRAKWLWVRDFLVLMKLCTPNVLKKKKISG